MSRFTPSRALLLVSAGTALLSAATLASSHGQAGHYFQTDTTHQVADCLDSLIQPRFQDNRAGVFGLTRVVTPEQLAGVRGHMGLAVLQPKTPTEAALLHQANAAHRDYVVAFLHCAHVPGHLRDTTLLPNYRTAGEKPYLQTLATHPVRQIDAAQQAQVVNLFGRTHLSDADTAAISRKAISDLPSLRQGISQEVSVNNWLVVMRPIAAAHDSCLGCHEGAHHGDTLGVMVYAVSKKPDTGG